MKFSLGESIFGSKKSAIDTIKGNLSMDMVPHSLLAAAITLHSDRENKLKHFKCFVITTNKEWGSKCFGIESIDGTVEPFSIEACFRPATEHGNEINTLRQETYQQCQYYKANVLQVCAICNSSKRLEIDHKINFIDLVFNWKRETEFRPFQEYHKENAVLQLLCHSCHFSKTFGRIPTDLMKNAFDKYAFLD